MTTIQGNMRLNFYQQYLHVQRLYWKGPERSEVVLKQDICVLLFSYPTRVANEISPRIVGKVKPGVSQSRNIGDRKRFHVLTTYQSPCKTSKSRP